MLMPTDTVGAVSGVICRKLMDATGSEITRTTWMGLGFRGLGFRVWTTVKTRFG